LEQKYFIWHEKKKWNIRRVMGKVKKKMNLEVLKVSPYVSKGVPWSCLDPLICQKLTIFQSQDSKAYINPKGMFKV